VKEGTFRLICLTGGIFLFAFLFYVMMANFYSGVVGVMVAMVEGGAYHALLFDSSLVVLGLVLAFLASFLMAMGLVKKEDKT
jgi:hypothetical protein